jgi:hypothetical protein
MLERLDAHEGGSIDLGRLVVDLQGLMGAADLHDQHLVDEFWNFCAPIDMELELRTESWAPAGSASDEQLSAAMRDYRLWVERVLATTNDERS